MITIWECIGVCIKLNMITTAIIQLKMMIITLCQLMGVHQTIQVVVTLLYS